MNRRELLKSCAAFAACATAGALAVSSKRYGPMTYERHRRLGLSGVHIHVFHQGRDVTTRCRYVDDTGDGMAELYKEKPDTTGRLRKYLDRQTKNAAIEIVHGVTMAEGAPL